MGFARFVVRQAGIALDLAERGLRGRRYKARILEITDRPFWILITDSGNPEKVIESNHN